MHLSNLSVEYLLLLQCAKSVLHGHESDKCLLGNSVLDWASFQDISGRHGLAPIVHRYFGICPNASSVPAPIRQKFLNGYRENVRRTLLLSKELYRIHKKFTDHRIDIVPFKGPILGQLAYDDLCLRPFCDIDLLIKKSDVIRAKMLLLEDGYLPEFNLDSRGETALLETGCEYCFIHPKNRKMVELHWKIVPDYASFGLSTDDIWKNIVPIEFFGRRMMAPSPEYMFLITLVHNGGKHQWENLLWVQDIAQLIRMKLDWKTIILEHKGIQRNLNLGLFMAQDLFSVELPEEVAGQIQSDRKTRAFASEVYSKLFNKTEIASGRLEHLRFSLKIRDNPWDKIRYCWAQLAMSDIEDRRLINLPKPLSALYSIMRAARWLGLWHASSGCS
jgi:hypothetical protein